MRRARLAAASRSRRNDRYEAALAALREDTRGWWADTLARDHEDQGDGEALEPDKFERLGRYEVHLDRKLERMLAMLLHLKDLRRPTVDG